MNTTASDLFLADLHNAKSATRFTVAGSGFIFVAGEVEIEWEWTGYSQVTRTMTDESDDDMDITIKKFTGFAEARALQLFLQNTRPIYRPDYTRARGVLAGKVPDVPAEYLIRKLRDSYDILDNDETDTA